jgi:hypothetical protein
MLMYGCSLSGSLETLPIETSAYHTPIAKVTESINPTSTKTLEKTQTAGAMSAQDKQRLLTQVFETNGGCQLPCYWGITPGETSWESASEFLSSIGNIYGPGGKGVVASYGPVFEDIKGDLGNMYPGFWVRDGIVVAITTSSRWVRKDFDFSLAGLLAQFGVPEEIWVRPVIESSDDQPYYELALWYPSKGIVVNWEGNSTKNGDNLSICPQNIFSRVPYPPRLILWSPSEQVDFNHFGFELLDDDLGWLTQDFKPFSELSIDNLTNKDFYELYKSTDIATCTNVIPVY